MRTASKETQTTEISPGLFANVDRVTLDSMAKESVDYVAEVVWLSDAEGNRKGNYYCSCSSGDCSKSAYCDTGKVVDCDCIRCTFSCS